jgi:hypothetical protein
MAFAFLPIRCKLQEPRCFRLRKELTGDPRSQDLGKATHDQCAGQPSISFVELPVTGMIPVEALDHRVDDAELPHRTRLTICALCSKILRSVEELGSLHEFDGSLKLFKITPRIRPYLSSTTV